MNEATEIMTESSDHVESNNLELLFDGFFADYSALPCLKYLPPTTCKRIAIILVDEIVLTESFCGFSDDAVTRVQAELDNVTPPEDVDNWNHTTNLFIESIHNAVTSHQLVQLIYSIAARGNERVTEMMIIMMVEDAIKRQLMAAYEDINATLAPLRLTMDDVQTPVPTD